MNISPRLRPAMSRAPRLPTAAAVPLLATCALTGGLGVGILWGASQIGETRSQPADLTPIVVRQPAAAKSTVVQDRAPSAIAQALAASDEAFLLVPPPPIALDPFKVATLRADGEAPFTAIAAIAAPVQDVAPVRAAAPVVAEVAGRMAKIAPSSDGLPARVRAKPTTSAEIVARIPIGTQLRVLGPADGARDWLRVTWNGITGYVHADLIR